MIRVKIIETEDPENMLEAIHQIAGWLHNICQSEKFCQHQNAFCYECNLRSLCEESLELHDWAVSSKERYKDIFNVV